MQTSSGPGSPAARRRGLSIDHHEITRRPSLPTLSRGHFYHLSRATQSTANLPKIPLQEKRKASLPTSHPPLSPSHKSNKSAVMRSKPSFSSPTRPKTSVDSSFDVISASSAESVRDESIESSVLEERRPVFLPRSPRMEVADDYFKRRLRRGKDDLWADDDITDSQVAQRLVMQSTPPVEQDQAVDSSSLLPDDSSDLGSFRGSISANSLTKSLSLSTSTKDLSHFPSGIIPRDPRYEEQRRHLRGESDDSILQPPARMLSLTDILTDGLVTPRSAIVADFQHERDSFMPERTNDLRRQSATATTSSVSCASEHGSSRTRRQTEAGVLYQVISVWEKSPGHHLASSSGGHSLVSASSGRSPMILRAPIIKDVPGIRKRVTKRDSTQALSIDTPTSPRSIKRKQKEFAPASFSFGAKGPFAGLYDWRRAEIAVHRTGLVVITTSEDQIPIHSIPLSLISFHDVRAVDCSLFGKAACIQIIKPSTASPSQADDHFRPNSNRLSRSHNSSLSSVSGQSNDRDSIYIACASMEQANTLLTLLKAHAQPAILNKAKSRHSSQDRIETQKRSQEPLTASEVRIWRSLDFCISDMALSSISKNDPHARFATSRSTSHDSHGSSYDWQGAMPGAKTLVKDRTHKGETGNQEWFWEICADHNILARSTLQPRTSTSTNRQAFTFGDLPMHTTEIRLKLFEVTSVKGMREARQSGVVEISLATFQRNTFVENWYPLIERHENQPASLRGEVQIRMRLLDVPILPVCMYEEIIKQHKADDTPSLLYQIASFLHRETDTVADLLLKITSGLGLLDTRLNQMITTEIDGDTASANILFRGNSLLTKTLEIYMRMICGPFLEASLGEIVAALCSEEIELEINPDKLGPKDRPIAEQIRDLEKWTTYIWNSLYQARHRCPRVIRLLFHYIQSTVEQKYDSAVSESAKFTSISAFVFLRFFIPALLNPKLFSLVQYHPRPGVQRSLTLVAKTLQCLANLAKFGTKEAFMTPMNAFIDQNRESFVDYIYHISAPVEDLEPVVHVQGLHELYIARDRMRSDIAKEAIPSLPYLFDLGRDLALLCSIIAKEQNLLNASSKTKSNHSAELDHFIQQCVSVHHTAQSILHDILDGQRHLKVSFGPEEQRPSLDERVEYITLESDHADGPISLRHISRGRHRAQTVAASIQMPRTPLSLTRPPTPDRSDVGPTSPTRSRKRDGLFGDLASLRSHLPASPTASLHDHSEELSVISTSTDDGSERNSSRLKRMFSSRMHN